MDEILKRTQMLIGDGALLKLKNSRAAVFGVGGVGSYAAEALARCGVCDITLVDNDVVSPSNINRQLIALHSTVGMQKTQVMAERIRDINPKASVTRLDMFYTAQNAEKIDLSRFDVVIDAIDTISSKIELIVRAAGQNIKILSCMGAGNKLDPTGFEVCDIYKTSVCPLARVMRYELKKRGVKKLTVVYSKEVPHQCEQPDESQKARKIPPGSISFVPSAAGLILASEAVKLLISEDCLRREK